MGKRPLVTLLTDFGDQDGFVGTMKGVMLDICPAAQLVDITHAVPRQDVMAGAMVLRNAAGYFPVGTVHMAVVDPGVGTTREALVAINAWGQFVLPDNGLVTLVDRLAPLQAVYAVRNQGWCLPKRSATFHGRDVFAPVAAHLAMGLPPHLVGPAWPDWQRLDWPVPERKHKQVHGEIVYQDVFGNLFTNIEAHHVRRLPRPWRLRIGEHRLNGPKGAYGEVAAGQALFLWGSSGLLEIAVNGGHAGRHFSAAPGTTLTLAAIES